LANYVQYNKEEENYVGYFVTEAQTIEFFLR